MTKSEANEIFESKGSIALNKLIDYIFIECDNDKAADYIVEEVGCDKAIAQAMVQEMIPSDIPESPISKPPEVSCPRCNSTQIQIVKRGWKLTTGFLGSSKNERVCLSCMKKF